MVVPAPEELEITAADKQKARKRSFDYMGRTGHYEDPDKLLEEIEALRRMLADKV